MAHRTVRRIPALIAFVLASATFALAQAPTSPPSPAISPTAPRLVAQSAGSSKGRLIVVTQDHPQRWQTCRIQTFTQDKLVCSRAIGGPRIYLPRQIVALILPGDGNLRLRLVLGLNAGLGAAIWGTVALAAPCPACAAATGIAALLLFCAAGSILIGDEQPDRLVYLAPGQQLTGKHRFVQF